MTSDCSLATHRPGPVGACTYAARASGAEPIMGSNKNTRSAATGAGVGHYTKDLEMHMMDHPSDATAELYAWFRQIAEPLIPRAPTPSRRTFAARPTASVRQPGRGRSRSSHGSRRGHRPTRRSDTDDGGDGGGDGPAAAAVCRCGLALKAAA